MFCQNCGSELHENVRFCGKCGKQVVNNEVLNTNKPSSITSLLNSIAAKLSSLNDNNRENKFGLQINNFSLLVIGLCVVILLSIMLLPFNSLHFKDGETISVSLLQETYSRRSGTSENITTASRATFIFLFADLMLIAILQLKGKGKYNIITSAAFLGIVFINKMIIWIIWSEGRVNEPAKLHIGSILSSLLVLVIGALSFVGFIYKKQK